MSSKKILPHWRGLTRMVITLCGILSSPTIGYAHASLETGSASAGTAYKAVLKIPHGCSGQATTQVQVQLPEGVIGVKPMPKPGWTLATEKGAYAKAYPYYHGKALSEGVKVITWSGGRLLDEHYDEFVFTAFIAETIAPGSALAFATTQTCETGTVAWVEIAGPGQSPHDLKFPAPVLKIANPATAATAAPSFVADGLKIEGVWTRATPGGSTLGAGYLKITNTGKMPDRLIGGLLNGAQAVELHETVTTDGVAKMRRVQGGLEIAPGQTVELKPGSHHLMFLGLTTPLVAGVAAKGNLQFEKAGTVPVEFRIEPIGSKGAEHQH